MLILDQPFSLVASSAAFSALAFAFGRLVEADRDGCCPRDLLRDVEGVTGSSEVEAEFSW